MDALSDRFLVVIALRALNASLGLGLEEWLILWALGAAQRLGIPDGLIFGAGAAVKIWDYLLALTDFFIKDSSGRADNLAPMLLVVENLAGRALLALPRLKIEYQVGVIAIYAQGIVLG